MPGAVERIEQMVASRQPHFLVAAGADFPAQARRDIELRHVEAEIARSSPLQWLQALEEYRRVLSTYQSIARTAR